MESGKETQKKKKKKARSKKKSEQAYVLILHLTSTGTVNKYLNKPFTWKGGKTRAIQHNFNHQDK